MLQDNATSGSVNGSIRKYNDTNIIVPIIIFHNEKYWYNDMVVSSQYKTKKASVR